MEQKHIPHDIQYFIMGNNKIISLKILFKEEKQMKFSRVIYSIIVDWWQKGHQKWQEEQRQKQQQQQNLLAYQIACNLSGELASIFRGRNYMGLFTAHGIGDLYYERYFSPKNGRMIFMFTVRKATDCDLPASDLALLKRQLNQDIQQFKMETICEEGEQALAYFFPCIYRGACVVKVTNSPRSNRELILYIM